MILSGKPISKLILQELKQKVEGFKIKPSLLIISVGEDEASKSYVSNKLKLSSELGIFSKHIKLDSMCTEKHVLNTISQNSDKFSGVIVQLPLPSHINSETIVEHIPVDRDADCLHPHNIGKIYNVSDTLLYPCTPAGILELLFYYNIPLKGKKISLIGYGKLVNKPLLPLLVREGATVTICHKESSPEDIIYSCGNSDIIVSATGVPMLLNISHILKRVTFIDVGIHRIYPGHEHFKYLLNSSNKKLYDKNGYIFTGEIDPYIKENYCENYTPTLNGVGLMTTTMLMKNVVYLHSNKES